MADQGGASNQSPRVSKHWVKLFPNGVSDQKKNVIDAFWTGVVQQLNR